jgi:hypothetical protein
MVEAEPDDRQAARNAWIDQQMAATPGCRRSMCRTITVGITRYVRDVVPRSWIYSDAGRTAVISSRSRARVHAT